MSRTFTRRYKKNRNHASKKLWLYSKVVIYIKKESTKFKVFRTEFFWQTKTLWFEHIGEFSFILEFWLMYTYWIEYGMGFTILFTRNYLFIPYKLRITYTWDKKVWPRIREHSQTNLAISHFLVKQEKCRSVIVEQTNWASWDVMEVINRTVLFCHLESNRDTLHLVESGQATSEMLLTIRGLENDRQRCGVTVLMN